MKKQFGAAAVTIMLIMGSSAPAFAAAGSVQGWALADAEQAVLNQRPVDENEIRQHGEEYTQAFLTSFAQVSSSYQQAYRQGMQDGQGGRPATPPAGRVGRIAYQRGYERGTRLQQPPVDSGPLPATPPVGNQPVPTTGEPPLVATPQTPDREDYPPQELTPDQAKFIRRIAKSAQKVGMEYDLYPSVIIAQAALESNWGASSLARQPYHNLFGVKGTFRGRAVRQPTTEYNQEGKQLKINDYFRWYDNDYQSLCDYAETLNDPLYEGVHRSKATSYRKATRALLGRYATDPRYDRKLNRVIDSYHLTKYDRAVPTGTRENKASVITPPVAEPTVHDSPATVQRHHRLSWLSVVGGVGSAGALGLLRRFIN